MPIYEFACRGCGQRFEDLVRGPESSRCPRCEGADLQRLVSTFAVPSSSGGEVPGPGSCGSCGDPRGPGACQLD